MKEVAVLAYDGCWGWGCSPWRTFPHRLPVGGAYWPGAILSSAHPCIGPRGDGRQRPFAASGRDPGDRRGLRPAGDSRHRGSAAGRLTGCGEPGLDRAAIDAGARVLALTTGAAWLAASRRADGLLLASHWAYVRQLARRYPQCRFIGQRSYLQADGLYTTGSLGGCFDALLEIIARERGDRFAALRHPPAGRRCATPESDPAGSPQPSR